MIAPYPVPGAGSVDRQPAGPADSIPWALSAPRLSPLPWALPAPPWPYLLFAEGRPPLPLSTPPPCPLCVNALALDRAGWLPGGRPGLLPGPCPCACPQKGAFETRLIRFHFGPFCQNASDSKAPCLLVRKGSPCLCRIPPAGGPPCPALCLPALVVPAPWLRQQSSMMKCPLLWIALFHWAFLLSFPWHSLPTVKHGVLPGWTSLQFARSTVFGQYQQSVLPCGKLHNFCH